MSLVQPKLLSGVLPLVALVACTTTEVVQTDGVPSAKTLGEQKVIEETSAEGELKVARHQADERGRFVVSISPLDGSQRDRAFLVAESAYTRICGQPPAPANDALVASAAGPGIGRTGRRAPYYSAERTAYLVYMQCPGTVPNG